MKNHLTKVINGMTFKWATREFSKDFAKKKAYEFRKQGFYARVIDECVYICSK
jgi:hypothetical protein